MVREAQGLKLQEASLKKFQEGKIHILHCKNKDKIIKL